MRYIVLGLCIVAMNGCIPGKLGYIPYIVAMAKTLRARPTTNQSVVVGRTCIGPGFCAGR